MKTYKDMTTEEIKEQLEWSDQHEFSYGYSIWAFEEIERLNNIIKRFEEELREMYLTFGEFSEEYTENKIKLLKDSDKE